jgi:signal transduction histidine kinase
MNYTLKPLYYLGALLVSTVLSVSTSSIVQAVTPETLPPKETWLVGSEFDYPPYALVNEQGEADGFSVDLIKAVAEVMDVELQFTVGPWSEVRTALEQGEIDVLPLVSYSKERDRLFDFTVPHTASYAAIFTRKGSRSVQSLEDLRDQTVVVMKSDAAHDYLLQQNLSVNLTLVTELADALRLISSGKYEYAFVPMLPGLLLAQDLQLTNLEVAGKPIQISERGFSFAVKEGDTELLLRLNQGLDIIKANGKYDEIYDQWFGAIDPYSQAREETFQLIRKVGLAGAIGLLGILMWSLTLRKQVNRRTRELQKEIAERKQIELALRSSETREREKSEQLVQTLQELQQIQLQLIQNEKMSALGNLVAGIAHEINNPLGFIMGNLQPAHEYIHDLLHLLDLYQHTFPEPGTEIVREMAAIDLAYLKEDLPKLIRSMQEGVTRIQTISTSLRIFSRADNNQLVRFNIHEGLDSTLLILKHRLKATANRAPIQIIKDYGDIPDIECYAGQLNQVFMNILSNAIEALEASDRSDPIIWIQTDCLPINFGKIAPSVDLQPTDKIRICIRDNGVGMTEAVQHQIFDHLFTTKEVGKGTGLGLAIAHQIVVEKHRGTLTVTSQLGQGAEFIITLPTWNFCQLQAA